ncbi:MAG: hypothetical protein U1E17_01045 [Geminicoccaceae bacterium]
MQAAMQEAGETGGAVEVAGARGLADDLHPAFLDRASRVVGAGEQDGTGGAKWCPRRSPRIGVGLVW